MNAQAEIIKLVDWSYPTSPNAQRLGFKDGCWTLSTQPDYRTPPRAVSGHATKPAAIEAGNQIAGRWHLGQTF